MGWRDIAERQRICAARISDGICRRRRRGRVAVALARIASPQHPLYPLARQRTLSATLRGARARAESAEACRRRCAVPPGFQRRPDVQPEPRRAAHRAIAACQRNAWTRAPRLRPERLQAAYPAHAAPPWLRIRDG